MGDYADGEPVRRISRYMDSLQGVEITDLKLSYIKDLEKYILALGPKNEERQIMEQIKEATYKIHPSDEPGFVSALDSLYEKAARTEKAEKAAKAAAKAAKESAYQKQLEIARNMKEAGMAEESIAQFTKLPIAEIQAL